MPHAYLFEGPEGVGKELTARALATRLLCEDDRLVPDADACGQCAACRLMAAGNHPDFHLVHRGLHKVHPDRAIRQSKGLFLVVDLVRQFVIEPAALKPTLGRRRVFLIRDAERMNEEAQNALLKTLEEPPGSACLILVTASAGRLLPTIRSRCQFVPFGLLPAEFVADELSGRLGLPSSDAQSLARLADGRLGVAIRWHGLGLLDALPVVAECRAGLADRDPEAFANRLVELASKLALRSTEVGEEGPDEPDTRDQEDTLSSAGKAVPTDELRDALKLVLLLMGAIHRDALVARTGAAPLRQVPQEQPRVNRLAAEVLPERLEACLQAVREAEYMLDRNVAPQLACERLAVALLGEAPAL
jgi:DNA polymerase-3 subunit delta'